MMPYASVVVHKVDHNGTMGTHYLFALFQPGSCLPNDMEATDWTRFNKLRQHVTNMWHKDTMSSAARSTTAHLFDHRILLSTGPPSRTISWGWLSQ